jgi:hypothetical protein
VVALAHGYRAITITGQQQQVDAGKGTEEYAVDLDAVENAALFVEALVRHMDDLSEDRIAL